MQDSLLGFVTPDVWSALLTQEKRRRGLADTKLVFIGVRNLARMAWCPMQAVRESRMSEVSLFGTYLEDRLDLALEMKRMYSLPKDQRHWLELAAAEVPLATVEPLWVPNMPDRFDDFPEYWEIFAGERSWVEPDAPTMRWHFAVEGYVVIGEPDGLSRSEVLEAKSSRNEYLAGHQRPVAKLQADLYGFLFDRPTKILCETVGDGPLLFDESPVQRDKAIECLRKFARIESGWVPAAPIDAWKCRRCEVEAGCPISRAREI